MVKFIFQLLIIIIVLFILPVFVSAWFAVPLGNDHAELTSQSILAVNNNDSMNIYSELVSYTSSVEDGAGELDRKALFGKVPKNKQNYLDSDYSHFYHPNGSAFNNQWPSALNESYDWLAEAISAYAKGDKDVAYTKLGYLLHLLEDVAVPAHSHLIFHGSNPVDYLEFKADAENIDASTQNPVKVYPLQGNDLSAIEKQFNELARKSYNESDVQSVINTYYGNGSYIGANGDCGVPLLGQTCSPAILLADVTTLQNDLMPKSVRYSAGLAMRVYDIFQSLDWPTENHDFRRTGFTLLKGDMKRAQDVEKLSFVLESTGITGQDQVVKSIVADIDGNGAMETVSLVHKTAQNDRTRIYAVEIEKKRNLYGSGYKYPTTQKWSATAMGGAIYFPGMQVNIDNKLKNEAI